MEHVAGLGEAVAVVSLGDAGREEVGSIRLKEEVVEREATCDLMHAASVGEGDEAGDAQLASREKLQPGGGHRPGPCEAVPVDGVVGRHLQLLQQLPALLLPASDVED